MSSLLLIGPTWYAADGTSSHGDVLLTDGVVAEVGTVDAPADATRLDADGLVLLPGFVDLHTHLREPGREDTETIASGSRAAAVGGYTAVLAMANTTPVTDTAEAAERILDLGCGPGRVASRCHACAVSRARRARWGSGLVQRGRGGGWFRDGRGRLSIELARPLLGRNDLRQVRSRDGRFDEVPPVGMQIESERLIIVEQLLRIRHAAHSIGAAS